MFIVYAIVAALMSAVLLASAGAKFTRPKRLVEQMSTLGLPYGVLPFLGVVQIAGRRMASSSGSGGGPRNRFRRRPGALLPRRGRHTPTRQRLHGRTPGSRPHGHGNRTHRTPLRKSVGGQLITVQDGCASGTGAVECGISGQCCRGRWDMVILAR